MNKRSIVLLTFIAFMMISAINVSGYSYSGTIYENGDQYWDDNEIEFYDFELDDGDLFDLSLSSSGELILMVCTCDSYEDVQEIIDEVTYYGDSDDLYLAINSYSVTSGSFTANDRIDVSVAIFSVSSYNYPSVTYTMETNIPEGDRIDDGGWVIFLVLALIVGGIIFYVAKSNNNKSKTTSTYNSPQSNYTSSASKYQGYNTGYSQSSTSEPSPPSSDQPPLERVYCGNCGSQAKGNFCSTCGSSLL